MEANKVTLSHKLPSDGGMAKEEFIRVGTTLYKIVEQPRLNGGYVKKRIAWNNETLRQHPMAASHIRQRQCGCRTSAHGREDSAHPRHGRADSDGRA